MIATVKKYKDTTHSKHSPPVHEHMLNQTFTAALPGNIRKMNVTYAVYTDDCRLVHGRMTKDLVQRVLDRAYARHQPPTAGPSIAAVSKHL